MDYIQEIKLAEQCGLVFVGFEDNDAQYMGEDEAWDKFNKALK